MALTVSNNSVQQINAALLSMKKEIEKVNDSSNNELTEVKAEQKLSQYTFKSPLKNTDNTITVDTTGVWEGTARSAVNAEKADYCANSDYATTAGTATNADITKTADTTNGDKLQIGSGTAINVTNSKHASSADNLASGGTSGQVLTSNGSTTAPSWQTLSTGLSVTTLYSGSFNTASSNITLSDSINNYKALVVMVAMYGTEQMVSVFVPSVAYFWKGTSSYANGFIANGTINGTTRRMYFGFLSSAPTKLYTGSVEGTASYLPAIKYVIGLN